MERKLGLCIVAANAALVSLALFFVLSGRLTALNFTLDLHALPLGDGKISTEPQTGYVWSCQTQFNGKGAFRDGDWINSNGTWDKTAKVMVDGSVNWANAKFSIAVADESRTITGNDLPNHPTGIFPIQSSDDAYLYDHNPNSITEQKLAFSLPLNPTLSDSPSCLPMGMIGVLNSGVALFNALDGEGRDAAAHEVQDSCEGHPEITGEYHYHTLSPCVQTGSDTSGKSQLMGYALDGFGIYVSFDENGHLLTNADLDECHGRSSEIEWNGQTVVMYHYEASAEYPYTIGCFRGTPVQVQQALGNGQGQQPPPRPTPGSGNPPPGGPGGAPPPPPPGQNRP